MKRLLNLLLISVIYIAVFGCGSASEKQNDESSVVDNMSGEPDVATYDITRLVRVDVSTMNFRTEPSSPVTSCPKLFYGALLSVLEEQGEWYRVEDMYDNMGWARASYEGKTYLKELPSDYLMNRITAREAYEQTLPEALEWATDAYLVMVYSASTGWDGSSDIWSCCYYAPSKRELLPELVSDDPEEASKWFQYLQITIKPGGTYRNLDQSMDPPPVDIFHPPSIRQNDTFINSDTLFAPSKIESIRAESEVGYKRNLYGVAVNTYEDEAGKGTFDYREYLNEWFTSDENVMLVLSENKWVLYGAFGPSIEIDAESGDIIKK